MEQAFLIGDARGVVRKLEEGIYVAEAEVGGESLAWLDSTVEKAQAGLMKLASIKRVG